MVGPYQLSLNSILIYFCPLGNFGSGWERVEERILEGSRLGPSFEGIILYLSGVTEEKLWKILRQAVLSVEPSNC